MKMNYSTTYTIDTDDCFAEVDVDLEYYSIGNDSFDHAFGTEHLPDYVEEATWNVIEKTIPAEVFEVYSIEEINKIINEDMDWNENEGVIIMDTINEYNAEMRADI